MQVDVAGLRRDDETSGQAGFDRPQSSSTIDGVMIFGSAASAINAGSAVCAMNVNARSSATSNAAVVTTLMPSAP